uniref:Uncharacterized protein n=1 Tax=Grammatophora oceanica TaxID=210454 RepID=A0A7S1VRP6_9STRA|mmetsp:Transcript_54213/g.80890  ORF Transcript_54213/g.80890 Transcript_54213/m.80890 type:complete len:161 (+) Transcript_54213:89-571(+)
MSSSVIARSLARPLVATALRGRVAARAVCVADMHSITYSGGQATEGQGGYYGSGGARATAGTIEPKEDKKGTLLALAADVQNIDNVMTECHELEASLEKEENAVTSPKAMELRQTMKKLLTSSDFMESLNRLEIKGSPIWGLSSSEREMIVYAREKVNEC